MSKRSSQATTTSPPPTRGELDTLVKRGVNDTTLSSCELLIDGILQAVGLSQPLRATDQCKLLRHVLVTVIDQARTVSLAERTKHKLADLVDVPSCRVAGAGELLLLTHKDDFAMMRDFVCEKKGRKWDKIEQNLDNQGGLSPVKLCASVWIGNLSAKSGQRHKNKMLDALAEAVLTHAKDNRRELLKWIADNLDAPSTVRENPASTDESTEVPDESGISPQPTTSSGPSSDTLHGDSFAHWIPKHRTSLPIDDLIKLADEALHKPAGNRRIRSTPMDEIVDLADLLTDRGVWPKAWALYEMAQAGVAPWRRALLGSDQQWISAWLGKTRWMLMTRESNAVKRDQDAAIMSLGLGGSVWRPNILQQGAIEEYCGDIGRLAALNTAQRTGTLDGEEVAGTLSRYCKAEQRYSRCRDNDQLLRARTKHATITAFLDIRSALRPFAIIEPDLVLSDGDTVQFRFLVSRSKLRLIQGCADQSDYHVCRDVMARSAGFNMYWHAEAVMTACLIGKSAGLLSPDDEKMLQERVHQLYLEPYRRDRRELFERGIRNGGRLYDDVDQFDLITD